MKRSAWASKCTNQCDGRSLSGRRRLSGARTLKRTFVSDTYWTRQRMSALAEALESVARVLNRFVDEGRCEGWYVFGAQAVAVRGAPRATQDVDITAAMAKSDVPELTQELSEAGLQHRYPESAGTLLATAAVVPLSHVSGMDVDLIIGSSGLERLTSQRAELVRVDGISVPVARSTELVVLKVLAGRGKDIDDVRALIAGGGVDEDEARDLLRQMEAALERSDLVSALESALSALA